MGDEVEMDGKEGRLLAGRYRLAGVLGRGGMGTVWRARDEVLGRTVAVKELRFPGGVEEDEKRRLITRTLREAKAIARIRNNGAVTVYDVVDEDDRPWIVMELVEGRSLAELVRDDGPLTTRRAAEVGLAVLDVLRAAHREGILHRDVKPSNVLMSDDGRVVLTDFGIAQVEGDPSVTSTGMLVGAPSYISPERARGHKPGPPADLWSLGGLLYACVEGVPPYDKGSAIATLTAVMTEPLEPPKHAGALTDVIFGLLVKDPGGRLDDGGARALLEKVVHAPEKTEPPLDATRAMALPVVPEEAAEPRPAAKPKPAPRPAKSRQRKPKAAPRPAPKAGAGAAGAGAASQAPGSAAAQAAAPAPAPEKPRSGAAAGGGASAKAAGSARPGFDSEAAKERMRDALKTVRAAAASAASSAASAASAARSRSGSGSGPGSGSGGGRPPRASVTDVVPRRTLVIIAVVVALAVVAAVLGFALSGGDPGNSAAAGKDIEATAAQTHASRGGGAPDGDRGTPSGDAPSTPDAGGDGKKGDGKDKGGKKDEPPAGYANVANGDFHFRVAMPKGWHRTGTSGQNSGAIFSKDGDGFPRLQIDFNASPGKDAAASWRQQEPAVRSSTPDYHLIGIKSVDWRDYPTVADWSFTRTSHGQHVRVLDRGFRVDGSHGYAIMITCKADAWSGEECRKLRDTAFATFAVKD
ncbi:protein kinase [Streptomyces sp. NPDC059080]|uniref:protein kinase domain-containing protein n=1 Tax=Streptomyces sp. NPDC059080 TaxID=3346718 RepID=UPI0036D15C29